MRKVLALVLCAGVLAGSFATKSRVLSMGKHDDFFMDETSIFRNPANVSIYPNLLMGSYGEYRVLPEDSASNSGDYAALNRNNRDPRDPFFGAILSYSLQQSSEEGNQYPMISVGAVLNRKDKMLGLINADKYRSVLPDPVGKVDLMLSYALPNGGMIGAGSYLAFQTDKDDGLETEDKTQLLKGTLGLNWPVARSMDLEGSVGISQFSAYHRSDRDKSQDVVLADNDYSFNVSARLFSALTSLNGDFVPQAGLEWGSLKEGDYTYVDVHGGIGLNVNIDKGFFWAGLEGLYSLDDDKDSGQVDKIGARISFGIERNVVWDWFVVRVGGQKVVWRVEETGDDVHTYFAENPEHDSDDDMVGLGIGLNVENRLKFDILVAEDVVYTLSNLISGPQHHIFTRIDATFSF